MRRPATEKGRVRRMRKGIKAAIIATVSVVTAGAILVGALWYFGNKTDPVKVMPVENLSLGYYDSPMQYDGQVTADNLQSVYPSDTQSITEIFVKEGDAVKKGDKLLSYDTTLSEIQLEKQRIAVQQAELDLKNAKQDLERINAMKPYSPPPPTTQPTVPPTKPLEPVDELPHAMGGDGTEENPYRWLWSEELTFDHTFIESTLGEEKTEVWLAFEVREKNAIRGELLSRWGLHVTVTEAEDGTRDYQYSFFLPGDMPGMEEEPEPTAPPTTQWVDDSSGYTAAQIAEMRAEKKLEIRDLDLKHRMQKVEYEQMKKEAESGFVFATVDGTVTRLTDEETARMEGTPMLTVSGGGCYYISVSISEFDRETYPVGTEVTVNSWMYGTTFSGTVEKISDTPASSGGFYYGGNQNASYYNATIAVPPDAELHEYEYVGVQFGAPQEETNGIYLSSMYVRTEKGRSYVYKRGEDGLLTKCFVRTGDMLFGNTVKILSGLTLEDWIAFPYGKDVKEGAETVEDTSMDAVYFGA